MRLQWFQMGLQIIIKDFGSHFAFQSNFFIYLTIQVLLEVYVIFVVLRSFELHYILRYHLLRLNRMKILLICNQIPSCFFGVFQLFEFNQENIIQLFKVLLHVICSNTARYFKMNVFKLALEESLLLLVFFHHGFLPRVCFVLIELKTKLLTFKSLQMLINFSSHDQTKLICFG